MRKFIMVLFILAAIAFAGFATFAAYLPKEKLPLIISITDFFSSMIPILAAGALLNYLWKNICCGCCCGEKCSCKSTEVVDDKHHSCGCEK